MDDFEISTSNILESFRYHLLTINTSMEIWFELGFGLLTFLFTTI